jgi:pimeloyl-ACP methyl ester carboxylesterase
MPTYETAVLSDLPPNEHEFRIAFLQSIPKGSSLKDVKGTILFCHGFPETSHQFAKVLQPIADQTGYLTIAPDMRGHGYSSRPLDGPEGFTKSIISRDFKEVIYKHLKLGDKPVHVVGHDIGAMVAVRYAMQFPDIKSLIFGEAPAPGTKAYQDAWNR